MTEFYEFVTETFGNWLVFTLVVAGVSHFLGVLVGAYMQDWSAKPTPPHTREHDEHETNYL